MSAAVPGAALAVYTDCRLCGSRLFYNREHVGRRDDMNHGVCAECQGRPEARRFMGPTPAPIARTSAAPPAKPRVPRAFNAAERALIKSLRQLPAEQLLDILNGRAAAEPNHVPFTRTQLVEELEKHLEAAAAGGEWASLRKLVGQARRSGLLVTVTLQVVDDFAVVFGLSPAQHMRLRDVIRNAQEGR